MTIEELIDACGNHLHSIEMNSTEGINYNPDFRFYLYSTFSKDKGPAFHSPTVRGCLEKLLLKINEQTNIS